MAAEPWPARPLLYSWRALRRLSARRPAHGHAARAGPAAKGDDAIYADHAVLVRLPWVHIPKRRGALLGGRQYSLDDPTVCYLGLGFTCQLSEVPPDDR